MSSGGDLKGAVRALRAVGDEFNGANWCKNAPALDGDGAPANPCATDARQWCLTGMLRRYCAGNFGLRWLAVYEASRRELERVVGGCAADWNDRPDTTLFDVQAACLGAAASLEELRGHE